MDAMMRRYDSAGHKPQLRARRTKLAFRENLRIRVPQVETPLVEDDEGLESPDSSDSSGEESNSDDESGSDSDGDDELEDEDEDEDEEEEEDEIEGEDEDEEDDEEEEEEEEEDDGAEADDEEEDEEENEDGTPALVTMTHAPPVPTNTLSPSDIVAAPQLPSTDSFSTSILPTETAVPDAVESADSITASSTGIVATADAETDPDFIGEGASSGSSNRGADAGIIVGTLALAVLLVMGGVFFYRWRLNRKGQHSDLSSAGRPSTSGSDHVGLVSPQMAEQPGQNGLYGNSLGIYASGPDPVQDQPIPAYNAPANPDPRSLAMEALTGHPITPNLPPLQPVAAYQPNQRTTDDNGVSPVESISFFPSAGGATVAPPYQQQRQQPDVPQVHVTPASMSQGSQPLGLHYPPGSYRISVARTETTDATEGTWRTWGVDQRRPTHQQGKGWKERYLS